MFRRFASSFAAKAAGAVALVALGDWLFWQGEGLGSKLGMFALAWAMVTMLLSRAAWFDQRSRIAWLAALALGALLTDRPGLFALILFCAALGMTALLPRFDRFDHAGRWALRLIVLGATAIVGPWRDLFRLRRHGCLRLNLPALLALLPLPLIGGAVFLTLFASANPLISDALLRIGVPQLDFELIARCIFWSVLLIAVWATLRPRRFLLRSAPEGSDVPIAIPGITTGSVTLALLTFNALFAIQNGLDLAFLWSGAPLPDGVTLADYAHRGAYPLIATALLAGLFVLVALQPGSETAAVPAIRRLVVLWVFQNVFLVASSILRTLDYIDVYLLTELRIAALLWMALVALGLVLILWRMLRAKSAAWLINVNVAAALIAVTFGSTVDLGAVSASWNIRHAREVGGKGVDLDLCYLNWLGASSLVSLVRLEQRGDLTPDFAERVAWVRHQVLAGTIDQQNSGWWTWRNARRLGEVRAMLNGTKLPAPPAAGPTGRGCDGQPLPAPSPEPSPVVVEAQPNAAQGAEAAAALTNEAAR